MQATPRVPPRSRRATLAPAAAALLAQLRRVRRDASDSDAVHDARVAARRLLAAGELWLPPTRLRDRLCARLAKTIRRLGRVRNLDVSVGLLAKGAREDAEARAALAKCVRRQRRECRRQLGNWLSAERLRRMKKAIDAVLDRRQEGVDGGTPGPADLAPRLARILTLAGRGNPLDDPRRAHEIRREVRFLRYAHETLESEYSAAGFEAARRRFVALQDAAGRWHDLDVLARLAARARRKGRVGIPLGAFRRRIRTEMREPGEAFVRKLAALAGTKDLLLGERE